MESTGKYWIPVYNILEASCTIVLALAQFQGVHVGTDDAELFSLLDTHLSVHSSLDFLNRSLDIFRQVRGHIKGLVVLQQSGGLLWRVSPQQMGRGLQLIKANGFLRSPMILSENTSSNLILETVRQFWARFFSPVVKLVSFQW